MYLWIKAFHITAIVTWMAGMIVAPALLAGGAGQGTLAGMRRHFRTVSTPAMILALVLGVWLAVEGGWFRAGWLHAKILLVVVLAGLHGVLSGQLRRMSAGTQAAAPGWVAGLSVPVVLLVLGIAVLVVVKPGFG